MILAVWALSRTTGLPIGPVAWTPEPIGLLDSLATGYQAVVLAGSMYSFTRSPIREFGAPLQPGSRSAIVVYVLPALAFLLGGGHDHGLGVVPHLDLHLGHHFFHLVFFGGASFIFALYVTFLVRDDGWPKFSWRLDPDAFERW
ncbi:MAG TPA: hypothetical protein VHI54_12445 [Actinomycetota bacterium]|nr:hypothetical protein [Actinomycetota bacterium]